MSQMLCIQLIFMTLALTAADSPSPEAGVYMKQIWSPYCKGVSLMECPSSQAERLRNEIYSRMGQGETFQDVFADLQKRYGSSLRMSPEFEGREAAAFWIPWVVAVGVAIFVLVFWMTRKRRKLAPSSRTYKASASLQSRIQDELEDLRN